MATTISTETDVSATTTGGTHIKQYDGLYYEIFDGDTTHTIPPENLVAGDVTREHTALGTHSVDVKPTPESVNDLMFSEAYLWYGNDLLFRGELLKNGRDLKTADATLEGEGIGRELKKGAAAVVYKNTPYYRAISDYWERFTDFNATVTEPTTVKQKDDEKLFDSASSDDSLQDSVDLAETDPLYIDVAGDDLVLAQTCFTREGESLDRGDAFVDSDTTADWSGGSFIFLDSDNDFAEFDFNLDYKIVAEDLGIKFRDLFKSGVNSSDYLDGNLIVKIDGQEVANYSVGPDSGDDIDPRTQVSLAWRDRIQSGVELASGSHTLRIEATSDRGSPLDDVYRVDVVAPYDTRYPYTFDGSTDANDALAGPELYPDAVDKIVAGISTAENIESARIESTLNDVSNNQRWGLRNNTAADYVYTDNSQTASADFSASGADSYGTTPDAQIRLSRYGSQTTTPTSGINGQRLQDVSVFATTDDLGVIEGEKAFEGSHLENLQQLHDDGGMRFTIEYAFDAKPVKSYKPGDITRSKSWITLDSDTGRDVYDYWNHVVAVGRRRPEGRLRIEKPEPDEDGNISSAEIDRVGEVITRKKVFPDIINDRSQLAREAASYLNEGIRGDKFDGSIDIMASDVAPGYRYESLDAFDGRNVDLESVDYTIAAGDATGSLTFGGAQKTTETSSDIVKVKRDERDSRRSIGGGLSGDVIEDPDTDNVESPETITYEDYATLDPYDSSAGWDFFMGGSSDLEVVDGRLSHINDFTVVRDEVDAPDIYPETGDIVKYNINLPKTDNTVAIHGRVTCSFAGVASLGIDYTEDGLFVEIGFEQQLINETASDVTGDVQVQVLAEWRDEDSIYFEVTATDESDLSSSGSTTVSNDDLLNIPKGMSFKIVSDQTDETPDISPITGVKGGVE